MTALEELGEGYRLSSQQCGMYVEGWQTVTPSIAVLVECRAESLKQNALRRELDRLIQRHEILRTVYRVVPGLRYPLQYVAAQASSWTNIDGSASDEDVLSAAQASIRIQTGPIVGVVFSWRRTGPSRLAIAAPRYGIDAVAIQDLVRFWLDAYIHGGATRTDGDAVLQYLDYTAWQSELLTSELGRDGTRFWQGISAPELNQVRLPFEASGAGVARAVDTLALSAEANQSIGALARRVGLSAEYVLFGLWAAFLARIAQTESLSIGWHCTVRAAELQGALGCYVAKLPVQVRVDHEASVDAIVRQAADKLQACASWHECFDAAQLYDDGVAHNGGPPHGFEFEHVCLRELPDGFSCRRIDIDPGSARLKCECIESSREYVLRWRFGDAYTSDTITRWMKQFAALLEGVGRDPNRPLSRVSMLGDIERKLILCEFNPRPMEDGDRPELLHQLFEAQVERNADAVAVRCGDDSINYRQLEERANRLAGLLQERGARSEQVIGVFLGHSINAVTALLAVMKTGAAYVPLDPAYPAERIGYMIADAAISIVITERNYRSQLRDDGLDVVFVDDPHTSDLSPSKAVVGAGNLAYVIYTSGSTGKPKGVMVSHANVVASTVARFEFYRDPVSSFLLLSSFSFDSSVAGVFWTLGQGGTLYIPTEEEHRDPILVAGLVARHAISHLLTLPSFYVQILDHLDGTSLRCAIVAGEACRVEVVERHRQRAPGAMLVNEYGPTEGTVWSNAFPIAAGAEMAARIPIGRPISSMRGYVLDDRLELCPIGMSGELYIGGDGVARGYLARPGLTAQRFVPDPFSACERLYRTGDLVRYRHDGEVEYLGRIDNQVKVRGYRIEPGEIEESLRAHDRVHEVAVVADDDTDLGKRLRAYVVADIDGSEADVQAFLVGLGSHLRRCLPSSMVPAHFFLLPRLPLTPNGKLDRQALVDLNTSLGVRPGYVAPKSELECKLAEIWQSVLKIDSVGMNDNFFDLGGHSLLATRVTAQIRQHLSVDLPLGEIFDVASLGELATRVQLRISSRAAEIDLMDRLVADAEASR